MLRVERGNMSGNKLMKSQLLILAAVLALTACSRAGEEVGSFNNDWTGNEFQINAIKDPAIPNVVCHFASFDRGFIDRVSTGNWFETPSNSAIDCHAITPINAADLANVPKNEEIASQNASLLFKRLAVRRIVDMPNQSIIYLTYSREITGSSAKVGMSVVPFAQAAPASP
ncbi:MAG: CREA protein [Hyphomonadaceae bacterium]|nr:CREA protein [Hyphomonadaceae bacterium]